MALALEENDGPQTIFKEENKSETPNIAASLKSVQSTGSSSSSSSESCSDDDDDSSRRGDEFAPASPTRSVQRKRRSTSGRRPKTKKKWRLLDEGQVNGQPEQKRKKIAKLKEEDELSSDVLAARQEEEERRKRLNEQRSLDSGHGLAPAVPHQPLVVDCRTKRRADLIVLKSDSESDMETGFNDGGVVSSVLANMQASRTARQANVIEIDSDDDDEGENVRKGAPAVSAATQPVTKQWMMEDGRVLVNPGHPAGEEDIYLPPQVCRVVKQHQVSLVITVNSEHLPSRIFRL